MKTRIAELRKKAGLSQPQLAEMIGTKATMLGKLERGERDLTSAWINKLSAALNVTPAAIFTPPGDHTHFGWIERNGDVGEHADSERETGFDLQVQVTGDRGEVLGVLGRSVEHSKTKTEPMLRSYTVEHDPITVSLPREAQLVVDTSLGGSLREELTNRLALVTLEGEERKVFGTVVRPRGGNSFILVPVGGAARPEAIVIRIDPVVEIHLPTYSLG